MSTVQSTSNTASQALLDSVNGTKNSAKTNVDVTQDRFLKLLVTQMKNQDPLNPMDNAQVTSQMAQLSTVTGIDKLNTTMESLIGSVQSSQSYQASSMIGHNVLVTGNEVSTDGTGGYFGVDLPIGADKLTVTIKDAAGATIRTLTLGAQEAGTLPLNWDGYADDGAIAHASVSAGAVARAVDQRFLRDSRAGSEAGVRRQSRSSATRSSVMSSCGQASACEGQR